VASVIEEVKKGGKAFLVVRFTAQAWDEAGVVCLCEGDEYRVCVGTCVCGWVSVSDGYGCRCGCGCRGVMNATQSIH